MTQIKKNELLKMYEDLSEDTLRQLGIYDEAREAYEKKKMLEEQKSEDIKEAMSLLEEIKNILNKHDLELKISRAGTKIVNKNDSTSWRKIAKKKTNFSVQNYTELYHSEKNEILIPIRGNSPIKYSVIILRKPIRHLFPGYMIHFTVRTNIGDIDCKITSAPEGTEMGDPEAGSYITSVERNALRNWYKNNTDIGIGDSFLIKILEPMEFYELKIVKDNIEKQVHKLNNTSIHTKEKIKKIEIGKRVFNKKFGEGVVLEVSGSGEKAKLKVQFGEIVEKILAAYVELVEV